MHVPGTDNSNFGGWHPHSLAQGRSWGESMPGRTNRHCKGSKWERAWTPVLFSISIAPNRESGAGQGGWDMLGGLAFILDVRRNHEMISIPRKLPFSLCGKGQWRINPDQDKPDTGESTLPTTKYLVSSRTERDKQGPSPRIFLHPVAPKHYGNGDSLYWGKGTMHEKFLLW